MKHSIIYGWIEKIKGIILESVEDKKVNPGDSLFLLLTDMDM